MLKSTKRYFSMVIHDVRNPVLSVQLALKEAMQTMTKLIFITNQQTVITKMCEIQQDSQNINHSPERLNPP